MKLHDYVTCSKDSISPGTSSLFDLQSDDYFLPTKRSVDEKRNVNQCSARRKSGWNS